MNTQFKKGVLELIVLKAIVADDLYGYQLVLRALRRQYDFTRLQKKSRFL